jgi:hypothetical protein
MDLSPESIEALIAACGTPSAPAHRRRRVRCQCGQCRQCLDDARWDRIFAEKFADPNYYTRRGVWGTSPLASI